MAAATKESATTQEGKTKLKAIEPIMHDGKKILPGQTFEADDGQAERLLKNKRAEKA